jgi:CubicO group peptidase (beta-lactamase class C family)
MVQKATGQKVVDYLKTRLFDPLGIAGQTWEESKQGVTTGGFGLKIKTEDIARFGQLYLKRGCGTAAPADGGVGGGRHLAADLERILSHERLGPGLRLPVLALPHGLYRGDGAFGQYCIVMPEQDAVVAITSGTRDMGAVMNLVWDHVLAGMKPKALPADDKARQALKARLAALAMPVQPGDAASPRAAELSGRTYAFPKNDDGVEAVTVDFAKDGVTLRLTQNGRESLIPCGQAAWKRGGTMALAGAVQPTAASGAWTAPDTYAARVWMYESPFQWTLGLRFEGDALHLDVEQNVGFGPAGGKHPTIVGRLRPN